MMLTPPGYFGLLGCRRFDNDPKWNSAKLEGAGDFCLDKSLPDYPLTDARQSSCAFETRIQNNNLKYCHEEIMRNRWIDNVRARYTNVIRNELGRLYVVGRINALSVFASWLLLMATVAYLVYAKSFLPKSASVLPLIYLFGAFMCFAVLHLVLACFVRCPGCKKCLTVQGFGKVHPATKGGWAKVVWRWFSGTVQCIHCGATVKT